MNSHHRIKHSKSDTIEGQTNIGEQVQPNSSSENTSEQINQIINTDEPPKKKVRKAPVKKKRANNQKIIYLMPGPVENVNIYLYKIDTINSKKLAH